MNGLNKPRKRKTVFHWIRKQKPDIVCLQETHVRKEDFRLIVNKQLGLEFYSLSQKKVKGVIFYINKDFNPKVVFLDSEGRYIAVEIDYEGKKTLLVGIYAPYDNKGKFFEKIAEELQNCIYDQVIMLGDFNGVSDPTWDRTFRLKKKKLEGNYRNPFLIW